LFFLELCIVIVITLTTITNTITSTTIIILIIKPVINRNGRATRSDRFGISATSTQATFAAKKTRKLSMVVRCLAAAVRKVALYCDRDVEQQITTICIYAGHHDQVLPLIGEGATLIWAVGDYQGGALIKQRPNDDLPDGGQDCCDDSHEEPIDLRRPTLLQAGQLVKFHPPFGDRYVLVAYSGPVATRRLHRHLGWVESLPFHFPVSSSAFRREDHKVDEALPLQAGNGPDNDDADAPL